MNDNNITANITKNKIKFLTLSKKVNSLFLFSNLLLSNLDIVDILKIINDSNDLKLIVAIELF
jgi:hypothetical protein